MSHYQNCCKMYIEDCEIDMHDGFNAKLERKRRRFAGFKADYNTKAAKKLEKTAVKDAKAERKVLTKAVRNHNKSIGLDKRANKEEATTAIRERR